MSASATLPWLLTTLFAGVVADRYDRRRVMLWTNLVRVVALGVGVGTVWAANSFLGAPLAGPLVALGAGWALGAPALLYLAGALLLIGVRGRFRAPRSASAAPTSVRAEIAEGLGFVVRHRIIRTLTLVSGTANAATSAFFAVFVLWVVGPGSAMGATPQVFGLLVSCLAVGAVAGPLLASRAVARYGSVRLLQPTWIVNGLLMLVPVVFPSVWVAAGTVVLLGVTNVMGNVMQMSMRQRMVPDQLMGRVQAAGRFLGAGSTPSVRCSAASSGRRSASSRCSTQRWRSSWSASCSRCGWSPRRPPGWRSRRPTGPSRPPGRLRGLPWAGRRTVASEPRQALEQTMSDKSPRSTSSKKSGKSLKEKRADKKSKSPGSNSHDQVAEARKR